MWASSCIQLPRPDRNKIQGPHGLQPCVVCGSQYNPLTSITDGIWELGHKFTVFTMVAFFFFFFWCQLFLPELLPALTAFYHLPLLAFSVLKVFSSTPTHTFYQFLPKLFFSTTGHWEPALTTHEDISQGVLLITSPTDTHGIPRPRDWWFKLKSLL